MSSTQRNPTKRSFTQDDLYAFFKKPDFKDKNLVKIMDTLFKSLINDYELDHVYILDDMQFNNELHRKTFIEAVKRAVDLGVDRAFGFVLEFEDETYSKFKKKTYEKSLYDQ